MSASCIIAGFRLRWDQGLQVANRSASKISQTVSQSASSFSTFPYSTRPLSMPMKPGSPMSGLDIYKNKETNPPPVAKEESEYPAWVGRLPHGLPSLASLNKKDFHSAPDKEQKRFLKLTRRNEIRNRNGSAVDSA